MRNAPDIKLQLA